MTDNVIPLGNVTRLDVPPDRILEEAKGKFDKGVVLIGWDKDGEFTFASSIADGGTVLWLTEIMKKRLLAAESEGG